MKKAILVFISVITLGLTGCASTAMRPITQATPEKVSSTQSRVIFMRPSKLGFAVNSAVYELQNENIKFVGLVNAGTKVAYDTDPGEHLFMVVGESADFMKAELLEGKTYYTIVTPRMGVMKARFSMRPVRTDGSTDFNTNMKEFSGWVSQMKWVENSPESTQWFEKNKSDLAAKNKAYWEKWQAKSQDEQFAATLLKTDGQ